MDHGSVFSSHIWKMMWGLVASGTLALAAPQAQVAVVGFAFAAAWAALVVSQWHLVRQSSEQFGRFLRDKPGLALCDRVGRWLLAVGLAALGVAAATRLVWLLDGIDRQVFNLCVLAGFVVATFIGGALHLTAWNSFGRSIERWIPTWKPGSP